MSEACAPESECVGTTASPLEECLILNLHKSIKEENIEATRKLLEIIKPTYSHIMSLTNVKNKELIQLVLSKCDLRGERILLDHLCEKEGDLDIVKWLLENYNFSESELTSFQIKALSKANLELAKIFDEHGAKLDFSKSTLRRISTSGSVDVLKFLLNKGLKLEEIDSISLTCFFVNHVREWILEKASEVLNSKDDEDKVRDL